LTKSICVFCGSRPGLSASFAAAAREFGRGVAERAWTLVYGGGDVGLMGICADAALAAGGEVVGIIPQRLLDREVGKRGITELVVTTTMFERKELMIGRSHAFVVLPGGLGTLDEIMEVLTLRQLGYHDKPVVIVDVDGYWAPLTSMFERVVATGYADAAIRDLYEVVPTVDAALDALAA
jgi:uncharacterized protein (TIGR00730 family)